MSSLLQKFAKLITRQPVLIVIIAVALLIPSFIGMAATKINYDVLTYLPQSLDSTKGEKVLENTFHDAATSMLVIDRKMSSRDIVALKEKIKTIKGVNDAVWVDDIADITIPSQILPDVLKDVFYSKNSTLMLVTYDGASSSSETLNAITSVRKVLNKQCFLSGFSAIVQDTKELSDKEVPVYVAVAVILSLIMMSLCVESWFMPFVFLLGIFFAVMYNMGTNIFLGQISYITKAIAGVLQLGVTMDYSIFLLNRYDEEKKFFDNSKDAMASAIPKTFVAISGSSITTLVGFLALCFMSFTLGKDIGIVMMKGVALGVLSTVLILPSLILLFDKPIHKYRHKSVIPDFSKGAAFQLKHRRIIILIALLVMIPAFFCQAHTKVYYNLSDTLPQSLDSMVATNKLKDDFDMAMTHFVVLDDKIPAYNMKKMTTEIKDLPGVKKVLSYNDIIGPTVPDSFIPQKIKDICKKDGRQLIMINSQYKTASNSGNEQIAKISATVKKYDKTAQVTGEGALTKDLIQVANHDFNVTGIISIIFILLVLLVTFKSVSIPVFLVAVIEVAIALNLGVPYLSGTTIPFITPTVINCIQLGATIDYSILMTTRFIEEIESGKSRKEAAIIASKTSFKSIITSSLVLFGATFGVTVVSEISIIKNICETLARGAVISAAMIILVLPPILYASEKIIAKTTYHWNQNIKKENA